MKKYAIIAISALIVACSTNPLTGRKSLSLVSNAEIFPQAFQAYDQTLSESAVLPTTSAEAKMVKKVGERIKYAAEKYYADNGMSAKLDGYDWEFSVIESNQLNAWCMPGGKVAFYTGILPVCQDETGIAVVMGHEVTHALAGHSAEQMSQGMLAQYGGAFGSTIKSDQWASLFSQYYPTAAQVGLLHYGRKMELDADGGGLKLMAMAGYDPREAVKFWQRMVQASGASGTPEFLSTHPNPENRIADIQALLPEAIALYNASPYKGK